MNNSVDIELIKKTSTLGLILGAIIGLFSVFPILTGLGIFLVMLFSSSVVLCYLSYYKKLELTLDHFQSMITGAIIGAASTIGFFIIYTPMVYIINAIFKAYENTVIGYVFKDALWLYILVVIVFAFIFAATNAVFGALTNIIIQKIRKIPSQANKQEESEQNG